MLGLLTIWGRSYGFGALVKYYLIPYIVGLIESLINIYIYPPLPVFSSLITGKLLPYGLAAGFHSVARVVILTFLQHSDPTIPHYRKVRLHMKFTRISYLCLPL